ncbi:DUF4270 family protein [Kaistella palustris]|uniref:DUF4270 family protein n=1 Tax=Kaistella palustris TaxID=493376 RepID=UPI0003FDF0DA|nr:DUF4270 family protein [Kaistella palustris]
MINKIEKLFKITAALVIGSVILWSCEPDADQLGSQFFQNGAVGTESSYPVIAYNVDNGDSIRTDAARLQSATLGAFDEPQFGLQKSAYVSQVRLSSYAPDFGTNPVLDSAVLVLKPTYPADSVTTTTVDDYVYPDGAVPAKKVVSTYPVTKYGKTKLNSKTVFNIKVNEVTDFLGANTDQIRSNRSVTTGSLIGSTVFKGDISAVVITKDADNTELYKREPSIRIPLDSTFFQNKIIKKGSSPDLTDAASFIRYFRGIKLSVNENDGYIFSFDPNSVVINLYYKKDKVDGSTTTREAGNFILDLGSSNTHFNQITFDRAGTPSANLVQDTINGAPKLYMQGMGGPGIGLRIPGETIAAVRDLYDTQKIGIISAKLRIYTDVATWNNAYKKPDYFVVKQKGLDTFLDDMRTLAYTGVYNLVKGHDLNANPAYYDIGITQTFKNIIELQNPQTGHFIANVGQYTTDVDGNLLGASYPSLGSQNFNTRTYTPYRVVFVGTEPGNEKSAKLILTYGKK